MDYQRLIHLNPIVPFAQNGFQKAAWCNLVVLMVSSVKSYQVTVYANTKADAAFLSQRLKTYIEQNPMMNSSGHPDDVSIGLRQPVTDPATQAYKVEMMMQTGMLRMGMIGGIESASCGGEFNKRIHDNDFWITRCKDTRGEFGSAFASGLNI